MGEGKQDENLLVPSTIMKWSQLELPYFAL